jgi:hypothetical protein
MSVINQSKDLLFVSVEELPKDPSTPFNKNWKWVQGKKPLAGEDGLIEYVVYDSAVLGFDGKPARKIKRIPEEWADVVNGIPGLRNPYPPPCDLLTDNQEFVVVGPGMWGVQEKGSKVVDPILLVLDRIEKKIDEIMEVVK